MVAWMKLPRGAEARAEFARETRRLLVAWLASLALVFGGVVTWILLARPEYAGWVWGQMFGLATLPGKYVIFSGVVDGSPLGPWGLALLAIGADLVVALTLATLLLPLGRLPGVGPALRKVHDRAESVLREYPRLRRMAFFGVVVFVYLPLPASGSIGGTFVGQLLGLTRTAGLLAVMLGGALVSVTFAALARVLGEQLQAMRENPWVTAGAVLAFALLVLLFWKRAQAILRR